MNKVWTMNGPADAPMVLERVGHGHPGHRGNPPRCHECNRRPKRCVCAGKMRGRRSDLIVVDEAV